MRFYTTNIDDRKRHEEKLKALNENLAAEDQDLRVANESTLEYASKLEDIIDERTVKLNVRIVIIGYNDACVTLGARAKHSIIILARY